MKSWSIYILFFCAFSKAIGEVEIEFNRDIRPILSDKCYKCHGPDSDNQKSDFQIHSFELATATHGNTRGIVPGQLKTSEVHRRIHLSNDDDEVMPPVDSNRSLSKKEKELIDAWITQGAQYDVHWSFKPIVRPALPELNQSVRQRAQNGIDYFIFDRLQKEGWTPSPEAPLSLRLRRAHLTLTGLPQAHHEEPFNDAVNYHEYVDRILQSSDYAERQTLRWLSAARYADTDGYQVDRARSNWPWRDWVIKAFRENMPFDKFTVEQLAGDMLPDASESQILASAFNRNHRQNSEGGALASEFFIENVIDRVETTSTVWLGLTMGCARCHDHKYDPLSQREFFQFFAYFNNIGERGIGRGTQANPVQSMYSPLIEPPPLLVKDLAIAEEQQSIATQGIADRRDQWIGKMTATLEESASHWDKQKVFSNVAVEKSKGRLEEAEAHSLIFRGSNTQNVQYRIRFRPEKTRVASLRIDALPDSSFGKPRQLAPSSNGNFVVTDIKVALVNDSSEARTPIKVKSISASFEQQGYPVSQAIDNNPKSGWAVYGPGASGPEIVSAYMSLEQPVELNEGNHIELLIAHESSFVNHNIGKLSILTSDRSESKQTLPQNIIAALVTLSDKRSRSQNKSLVDYYSKLDQPTKDAAAAVNKARKALEAAGVVRVPVMVMRERDGDPIPSYLLERGQYDAPDKSSTLPRKLPEALVSSKSGDQPGNRLELARWIVSSQNPLTARVIVNRIWQDHFGVGLVNTPEDFGSQGELPSHPGLLDWLAAEFIESGWDVKALHRLIVTSATYQQSSAVSEEQLKRDPMNRLLARGPRYRMDGFAIRDIALQSAGLLDSRVGGAPVMPYQPAGLWSSVASSASTRYQTSSGKDLYRKSLYTYWKRAVNPPRQLIFDAGGREACDVTVRRTNTPLQALVLMNDKTFIEAAMHLAQSVLLEPINKDQKLARIYQKATGLKISNHQLPILNQSLSFFLNHFELNPDEANQFLKFGDVLPQDNISPSELAAWASIAHLVLNLDVTISVQ